MSWNPFRKKKARILGVDIGTTSVKIVELSRGGQEKIELTNYGELKGGGDWVFQSASHKLSAQEAADAIKKITRAANIVPGDAIMSIPIFSGFSTVISLPVMSDSELGQAITYEAKKYIPLPLAEVQFEWMRLNSTTASKGETEVLVVAVTNELINRYHEIARLSALKLTHLELDIFSLARALVGEREEGVLVIDIGARGTVLSIVENGWPIFTRTLEVAGAEFSKVLSKSLAIDMTRAEDLKKKEGIEVGDGVLLPLVDSIILEGKRMMDDYIRKRKKVIPKIVLSGGSAAMPGFTKYAVKSFGRESIIGFPFHGILYPETLDSTLREVGPSYAVAVGLALREFVP
jgi:type IV pilus assembly protein PilM